LRNFGVKKKIYKMKKICLYSPYFPKHIGGGEKYFLDVATELAKYGEVALAVQIGEKDSSEVIYDRYQKFLGREIKDLKLINSPLGTTSSFTEKLLWTKQFDLLYAFTDGSFFPTLAKKNVLHIQTPLMRKPVSVVDRLKLFNWDFINTNSNFTKKIVENFWQVKVDAVHHPMVDVAEIEALQQATKKEKVILHVGRFFRQLHSKRQDVLVDFFADLVKSHPKEAKGWKLVLIGSVEDESYAKEVATKAKGYPIEIIHSISRKDLNKWYAKASIYWHATGFGFDQYQYPERMEHFGISTGEAMAGGAVPVVIKTGGQPEVLGKELAEWLWIEEKDCLEKTLRLMNNENLRNSVAYQATKKIHDFDQTNFAKNISEMMIEIKF